MDYRWLYLFALTIWINFSRVFSDYRQLPYKAYEGDKIIKIHIDTKKDARTVKDIMDEYKGELRDWSENYYKDNTVTIHVSRRIFEILIRKLNSYSLRYQTVADDLNVLINSERSKEKDDKYEEFGYNFAKHNTFRAVHDFLGGITKKYRRIARLHIVGCTYEKRPIYAVQISKSKSNPYILIECGIHAREWSAVEVCVYIISELLKQRTPKAKRIVSMYSFVIIPLVNPDGYVFSMTRDRMWRKNRNPGTSNKQGNRQCIGVDGNRNFDVEFCMDPGSSRNPCDETYCGEKPFSEKESRAIRNVMTKLGNRLFSYFSFHSAANLWMTPYAKTTKRPNDFRELLRVSKVAVDAIRSYNGTIYKTGSTAEAIYRCTGTSIDYIYDNSQAKYANVVELKDIPKRGMVGFIVPEREILPMCKETFEGLQASILAMKRTSH